MKALKITLLAVALSIPVACGAVLLKDWNLTEAERYERETFELPSNRKASELEAKITALLNEFKSSHAQSKRIALHSLLPKPLRKYCFQTSVEAEEDFEKRTGELVDGFRSPLSNNHPTKDGNIWWFFYTDGSYEAVYLDFLHGGLLNKDIGSSRSKCLSPRFLDLKRQILFEEQIPYVVFDFMEE